MEEHEKSREEVERLLETTVHEYSPEPEKKKGKVSTVQMLAIVGVFVGVALLAAWAGGAFQKTGTGDTSPDTAQQQKDAAKAAAKKTAKEKTIQDAVLGGQTPAAPETEAERVWREAQTDATAGNTTEEKISSMMQQLQAQDRAGENGYPPSADGPTAAEQYWRQKAERASRQENDPRSVYNVRGDNPAEEKQRLEKAREEYEKEKTPMFVYQREGAAAAAPAARARMQTVSEETPPETAAGANPQRNEPPPRQAAEETRQTTLFYTKYNPVTMYEGDFLDCVLLHRIISDTEESPVLGMVVRDLMDNSGKWVIIPQGTKVVGKTKIVDYSGAHRMYITFHRMILPDGVSVEFPYNVNALKALDRTGALGVTSKVNRHWMLQFGTALMFGVLDGLSAAAVAQTESKTGGYIVDRTSQNMDRIMDTILRRYQNIVPTITVNQGFRMRIYITDDVMVTPFCRVKDRPYAQSKRAAK